MAGVSDDELRQRLTALEDEVARLRQDAAAQHAPAGPPPADAVGRALAEVQATVLGHARLLDALRETQLEQGRTLEAQTRTLEQLAGVIGGLVTGTAQLNETLGRLAEGQAGALGRLGRIEDRLGPAAAPGA
jgi:ribosomal protein L29